MSKYARLENGQVKEIIPQAATTPSIAHWYGKAFAAECTEVPDDVSQGWALIDGAWVPPDIQSKTLAPGPTIDERLAALEDAACESDAANDARMAEIENALCELDGGVTNG